MRHGARVLIVLVLAAIGVGTTTFCLSNDCRSYKLSLPDDLNPWAELDPTAPPNLFTRMKLRRARDEPARCFIALEKLGAEYAKVSDRVTGPGCGFRNAIRISRIGQSTLQPRPIVSCQVALSIGMWERHTVQPAAQLHLRSTADSMRNMGGYACRNVNRGEGEPSSNHRSLHATADAIDIEAFVLADGRAVSVEADWSGKNSAGSDRSMLLRAAHEGACTFFDGVLGPDYNLAHRNHLHLEIGRGRFCR